MWLKVALRLFWRELRQGELWVIAFALMLAVFSVVSLSGITESIRHALTQRTSSFSAADLVLRSSVGFNEQVFEKAKKLGLQSAEQLQFNTMVFANNEMQLVNVKAVSREYPLRGQLKLSRQSQIFYAVNRGEIYLEARLFQLLKVAPGDRLDIGVHSFMVGGVIENEPDAPLNLFGGQPRVLMHLDDVAATKVLQPGSRISYRSLFAGTEPSLQRLRDEARGLLNLNEQWQALDRQSAIGNAIDKAEQFMLLAGLLGIVLACSAAAVGAGRYAERHRLAVAVIKALGTTTATVRRIYFSHLVLLTATSSLVGIALGVGCQQVVQWLMRRWIDDYQSQFSWHSIQLGVATALLCALLFSLRPLWRLTATSALTVLRAQQTAWRPDVWQLMFGSAAVLLLMYLFSQDAWLSLVLFSACAVFAALLLAFASLLVRLAKPMAAGQQSSLRLALANLRRRLWQNSFQLMTFSLAIFLTLVLVFLRTELITQWQQQVPADAPNHFLVNINEQEQDLVKSLLAQQQIATAQFYPMISGRVTAINGEGLVEPDENESKTPSRGEPQKNQQTTKSARTGFGRELNLTWLAQIPIGNTVTAGKWFSTDSKAEVSVEQQQAERLGLKLGDTLSFAIGGIAYKATVTSFRKVNWGSLQPNFFMILSPDLLRTVPATYMTALYISPSKLEGFTEVLRQFPTVSVISVGAILIQVNQIIDQVSLALTFILILVFIAACLVLMAQTQASVEQRQRELAILRTLGATARFLRQALILEFACLGLLAGIFATALAEIFLAVVQVRLFQLPFVLHSSLWLIGPMAGVLLLTLLTLGLLRRLLKPTPVQVIRQTVFDS